uniref:Uncharacterized protein n=1 Tax=Anguilla anguilla TaxID=7936 RepID=A0A0E9VSH4_ANGAN
MAVLEYWHLGTLSSQTRKWLKLRYHLASLNFSLIS